MKPEEFYVRLAELGFPLTDRQKEQYERYFELLVEWNEKINLTAITEKDEVYLKHFYDSIAPILQGFDRKSTHPPFGYRCWCRLSEPTNEDPISLSWMSPSLIPSIKRINFSPLAG